MTLCWKKKAPSNQPSSIPHSHSNQNVPTSSSLHSSLTLLDQQKCQLQGRGHPLSPLMSLKFSLSVLLSLGGGKQCQAPLLCGTAACSWEEVSGHSGPWSLPPTTKHKHYILSGYDQMSSIPQALNTLNLASPKCLTFLTYPLNPSILSS